MKRFRPTRLLSRIILANSFATYRAGKPSATADEAATSVWSQDFVYDGFGNLIGKTGTGGAPSWTPVNGVNPANNRLLGLSYDANGNQETIPMTAGMTDAFTASYDIDNRLTQMVNSSQSRRSEYDYDASNKRVWERRTGGPDAGEWVYFFGADGSRMGRYAVTVGSSSIALSQNQASVWFGGKLVQKAGSSWASPTWPNEDRLASVGRYLPYGEDKPGASNPGNDNEKFATYTRDPGTGIDYADQRWYGQGTGRFTRADPFDGSADPSEPTSWNRYQYVYGDPINLMDPNGLSTQTSAAGSFMPSCSTGGWQLTLGCSISRAGNFPASVSGLSLTGGPVQNYNPYHNYASVGGQSVRVGQDSIVGYNNPNFNSGLTDYLNQVRTAWSLNTWTVTAISSVSGSVIMPLPLRISGWVAGDDPARISLLMLLPQWGLSLRIEASVWNGFTSTGNFNLLTPIANSALNNNLYNSLSIPTINNPLDSQPPNTGALAQPLLNLSLGSNPNQTPATGGSGPVYIPPANIGFQLNSLYNLWNGGTCVPSALVFCPSP